MFDSGRFKKIKRVVHICTAIVCVVTLILWHFITNDPISSASMKYLWNSDELLEEISAEFYEGARVEITHIGRNIVEPTYEDGNLLSAPFGVYIGDDIYLVYVTLEKNNDEWIAVSYDLKEKYR